MSAFFIPLPPGYRAYWYSDEDGGFDEPVIGVWQDDDGTLPALVTMTRDGELDTVDEFSPLVVLAPGEELKLGELQKAQETRERLRRHRAERMGAGG